MGGGGTSTTKSSTTTAKAVVVILEIVLVPPLPTTTPHWPHLLDVGVKFYEPLQVNGTINRASERLKEISKQHAIGISHFKPSTDEIPPEAWAMVLRYTAGVSRMVTIGHGFALWLRGVKQHGN